MRRSLFTIGLALAAMAAGQDGARPKIALVGDSTVAEGGGWGPGFLASFSSQIEVLNFARNGRSSKSFRDEGLWEPVVASKADYVLIQFGHNDVAGKGSDRETLPSTTYRENLARYAAEARTAGAIPILVTSIVRRNLTSDGKVKADSLAPYVAEVRKLASEKEILLMDLNALTLVQCEKLGPAACGILNATTEDGKPDTTHLSSTGQKEVGAIAAREFLRVVLPGQAGTDPKTVAAATLLPMTRERTLTAMPQQANPALPTLFILGDSTVHNQQGDGADRLWGWGDLLAGFFDSSRINVVNRAVPGMSGRTFWTYGHWDQISSQLRPGDFVIMQFGHNDTSPVNDPTRARGSLPGTGDETREITGQLTGQREAVHTYGWYLRQLIAGAQARGAMVIVCSPVPRKNTRLNDYGAWAAQVAQAQSAAFVDLSSIISTRYSQLGPDAVARFFPTDNTHTNRAGAALNGRSVIQGLKELGGNPLARYLSN